MISMAMRRVILESPFAAPTWWGRAANRRYARACLLDSLQRGEAPIASHLLYPHVLDDNDATEWSLGIMSGFAWGSVADAIVVYEDRGISPGMRAGINRALQNQRVVEFRRIQGWAPENRRLNLLSVLTLTS